MLKIHHKSIEALIDPHGAWVTELNNDDLPLLHPKIDLLSENGQRKSRGGMHVCLPNFGPGGDNKLAQHGFGRELDWEVVSHSGSRVELVLKGGAVRYADMESRIVYELFDDSFSAELVVKNRGKISVRLAPAFHPYFQLEEPETAIMVNEKVYDLTELVNTEFVEADEIRLRSAGRELSLVQHGLPVWAIWTDRLSEYVCVEPTFGGYRFLEQSSDDEQLQPNAKRIYGFSINW